MSIHGQNNFPIRKEPGDLDVELPDGCTDEPYLKALELALQQLMHTLGSRAPDLIFYLAGADPYRGDRLGRLALSPEGLAERDRRVLAFALSHRIPVAVSMAGGYGENIEETVDIQVQTLREAFGAWRRWRMD